MSVTPIHTSRITKESNTT